MSEDLYLTSPIPCSVNHYLKPRAFIVKGIPQVSVYVTAEAKKFKKDFTEVIHDAVNNQQFKKSQNKFQHYYVDCVFYFPRIDMDTNNYWKLLLDAITESGAVWIDDTQACERVKRIYYTSDNPRIEIHIHPVDYIGIFDNALQLKSFTDHCKDCNRYRDGKCSILVKSLEGKILPEISETQCIKFKRRK